MKNKFIIAGLILLLICLGLAFVLSQTEGNPSTKTSRELSNVHINYN